MTFDQEEEKVRREIFATELELVTKKHQERVLQ
jgi:hypothetical protein